MEPIRAERATVKFFDGLEVDGYRMPNGEFRVGLQGASLVLGFAENWLRRLLNRETGTQIKTLRGLGFTEETQKVVHESNKGILVHCSVNYLLRKRGLSNYINSKFVHVDLFHAFLQSSEVNLYSVPLSRDVLPPLRPISVM